MKAKKHIGVLTGLIVASTAALATFGDCCVLCGECSYTPPSTVTIPTTTTVYSGCIFCGGGSITTTTTTTVTTTHYSDFSKKQTVMGYYTNPDGDTAGTVTLAIGKIKNGKVSIKATLKSSDGKKKYSASATVAADAASGTASGKLPFSSKNIGTMTFALEYQEGAGMTFAGTSVNGYYMESYEVDVEEIEEIEDDGGVLGVLLAFSVDGSELEAPEGYDFVTDVPDGEPVYVGSNGKWKCDPAPSIKYKKYKEDGEVWYELVGLDDEKKTNISGLKISYNAKKGTFSGSFKIYVSNEGYTEKKPKIKSYTAKFTGQIVGSGGYGTAKVKIGKVTYSLPVVIETVE